MKKINVIFVFAAIVLLAAAATIMIYRGRNMETSECALYFLNQSGTSLAVENKRVSYKDDEDLPEAVLKQLIRGPENSQHSRVINRRTDLHYITNDENGNYTADFSGEFYPEDDSKAVFSVYAVVKTLCAIEGIHSVRVTVDGQDFTTRSGTVIGALTSDDINLSIDTDTGETNNVKLYFTDTATKKLTAEERSVRITDQQPVEQYIIAELIKGPEDSNHMAVLSDDTTLISVTISDNIGFVNFAKNFIDKNTNSPEQEEQTIFAIVNSMTELESINRVQFLVEGKKVAKFGEISIEHPIGRNHDIIE